MDSVMKELMGQNFFFGGGGRGAYRIFELEPPLTG